MSRPQSSDPRRSRLTSGRSKGAAGSRPLEQFRACTTLHLCCVLGCAALLLTGRRNARHRTHSERLTAHEQTGCGSGFDAKVCPAPSAVPVVCPPTPYHTIPYHATPYHTIPYHMPTMPCHDSPYHTIPSSCHVMPYYAMPCRITPCHNTPYRDRPFHRCHCDRTPQARRPPHPPADAKRRTPSPSYPGAEPKARACTRWPADLLRKSLESCSHESPEVCFVGCMCGR